MTRSKSAGLKVANILTIRTLNKDVNHPELGRKTRFSYATQELIFLIKKKRKKKKLSVSVMQYEVMFVY